MDTYFQRYKTQNLSQKQSVVDSKDPSVIKSMFNTGSIRGDKPRMIKYQIKKGHAGLGGRIVKVDEEKPRERYMEAPEQDFVSVKSLSTKNYSRPVTQQMTQRASRVKSQNNIIQSPLSPSNSFGVKRTSSPTSTLGYTMADLTSIKRLKIKKNEAQIEAPRRMETETEQCTEQRTEFVDQIPLNDPIWRSVIPEEMFNNPNVNIQKVINENFEYFHHQLSMCACFRCECGLCRCDYIKSVKLNLGINHPSVYGKDFQLKQNQYNLMSPLNATKYDTKFNQQEIIDLQSNQRVSYKPFNVKVQEKAQPKELAKSQEFLATSSYKSTFNNWGDPQTIYFKRPAHVSTTNALPFYGQTLYQNTFCNGEVGHPAQLIKIQSQLTPLPTGAGFQSVSKSQSQSTYLPFKIEPSKSNHNQEVHPIVQLFQQKSYQQSPSFQGQFQSLQTRDYTSTIMKTCPAKQFKKVLSLKVIQKMKQ